MSLKVKEKPAAKDKGNFETIVVRLEEIVDKLGQGDLPLEESLALFEEGVGLSKEGHKILDEAESRIEVLLESGETRPYGPAQKEKSNG
ncbi:MAG: exodeoxyribonuclease VII small subunit [Pseudomonadota bacterium]